MTQTNQATLAEKGNVRIYACGGAGINIGSMFEEFRGLNDKGTAVVQPSYLDTSRSNRKPSRSRRSRNPGDAFAGSQACDAGCQRLPVVLVR
jgi:hypothetical protein